MNKKQVLRINDVLYRIHRDIAAPISARDHAKQAAYSEQHFHRIFKAAIGESFNRYVRKIRLEHAANQLMFDSNSTVLEVAQKCGFWSLSSFNQAFKQHFDMTPGQWRVHENYSVKAPFLNDPEIRLGYQRIRGFSLPKPSIVDREPQLVAYLRHKGYNRSISRTWSLLNAWAIQNKRLDAVHQIGLHHSNPAWVDLAECRYVACLAIKSPLTRRDTVNQMTIPGGLHAEFRLQGQYGELLPWLSEILEKWLPTSGFKLQTTPILAHYHQNHFVNRQEKFDATLSIPISLM